MRESISAQSCASVPPAPALMVKMQLHLSCGPLRKGFQLECVEIGEQLFCVRFHFGFELRLHRFRLGGGEFEHHLQILHLLAEARERIELAANVICLVDDFLRRFLVVPESFAGHLRFEFGEPLGQFGDVKETSAGA
jgi:hypothetical protein